VLFFRSVSDISVDEVRARVREFWRLFTGKSVDKLAELYFPEAALLETDMRRIEPARLMLARRARELFSPAGSVDVELGPIDVQILALGVALAVYGFRLRTIRTMPNGKRLLSENPVMRATQVFQRDDVGLLRIIHEHWSSGTVSPPKEI